MKIGIVENQNFSQKAMDRLRTIGDLSCFEGDDLEFFVKDKNVLLIRLKYYFGKKILKLAKELEYLCSSTTGLNHIDLLAAKINNVEVISLKDETSFLSRIHATPEHTFGLVIALLRNYKSCFLGKETKVWDRNYYFGDEIYNNSVGIIGMGRIGRILAEYFNVFGAEVYYYDVDINVDIGNFGNKCSSIEDLIQGSNIILLCASYSGQYHGFFGKNYIDLLKNKYFINTSRGELINEEYLIEKMKSDYFKGVALDVISNEQMTNNLSEIKRSLKNKNIIITPHIGGATYQSLNMTEEFIVDKLIKKIKLT